MSGRTRAGSEGNSGALLEGRNLSFSYRDRSKPVPRGCNLRVYRGSRILLEGSSGAGKSTLGFNLLLGRCWPPKPEDFGRLEALCRELGLGSLLERMPSRLLQVVGESGWQLSHGEKSRVYIARALLQGAELVILDESFAALDPENLSRALQCVLDHAPTLLVIAHP